ncbi:MAG: radical SAM protein [Planctomycetes bacterium]|nr:radical SAM protein [Planctomycetota bacterium]
MSASSTANLERPAHDAVAHDVTLNNLVRLGLACNERCWFCNVPPGSPGEENFVPAERVREELARLGRAGVREVSLSGGEPTLRPDLPALVAAARAAGIPGVQIQTNGLALTPESIAALKNAGLTSVFFALHSHRPEVHDALTEVPGSWARTVAAMEAAGDAGLQVQANIVLVPENVRDLPEFVRFVRARFPALVCLSVAIVQPHGRAREHPDRLLSPVDAAEPFRLARREAERVGLALDNHYCSLPLCCLDREGAREAMEFRENRRLRALPGRLAAHPRIAAIFQDKTHGAPCRECVTRTFCNGLWREYGADAVWTRVEPGLRAVWLWNLPAEGDGGECAGPAPWGELGVCVVPVAAGCNNGCGFCADRQLSFLTDAGAMRALLARGRDLGCEQALFTGAEPTLLPDLPDLVAHARDLGYLAIHLATNARMLASRDYAQRLVEAGVTGVQALLLAPREEAHDRLARCAGAWRQAVSGVKNLVRCAAAERQPRAVVVVVGAPALEANYRTFPGLAQLAAHLGAAALFVVAPRAPARVPQNAGALLTALERCGEAAWATGVRFHTAGFERRGDRHDARRYEGVRPRFRVVTASPSPIQS